ncbi:MAG: hypothetical protein DME54_09700 [Verrucomicrobia bacterium]|nr:MAG: hypothetical protein DME54_09700 [Verrucomicrobiota bacterium]
MERTTFLEDYRIRTHRDGTPIELRRSGTAVTYEAADERAGETVALTTIPIESVDPAAQQQFEEHGRALQRLRHINIVKLLDFGREGENFVCVSDYLQGTTLAAWVGQHGPMPPDATLRMAEQVVSVLSSANFHKLAYPAIQPSNIIVVPGTTPEGTWPLIKLTDLGLLGFKDETGITEKDEESFPTAGTVDFRSQIYSLGATMYFLLTGSALSTPVRPRQLRVFPKPLRALLSQMLRRNPDQRPKDPVALAEMIRQCLLKTERRERFARRFGIPLIAKIPRTTPQRPRRLRRVALAASALIVLAAVIAVFLFPQRIGGIWRKSALAFGEQSPPNTSTATSSGQAASPNVQQAQTSSAQPEATASPANSPGESPNTPATTAENSTQVNATPPPAADTDQTGPRSKKKRVASSQGRAGSTRARMIGITSNGRLIYRLPSGRTRVIAPDGEEEESVPRRHRRAFIERDETFMPAQPFEPNFSPHD